MTTLPVIPPMTPKPVGLETWLRAQNRNHKQDAVERWPTDYQSAPTVPLDDCRDTVELFLYSDYSICNYHCPYCYVGWAPDDRKNWDSRALFHRLIYRLSQFRHRLNFNMENLGEWFTSKELIDATVFLLRRENVATVSITTNAGLVPRMLAFLEQVDVNKVAFTCTYHATEVELDRFLHAVAALRAARAHVGVAAVCFPDNLEHCLELKRRAADMGVHFRLNLEEKLWRESVDVPEDRRALLYNLLEDHRQWEAQRRGQLLGLSQTVGEPCVAGRGHLWINGYGDVFICSSALLMHGSIMNDRHEVLLGNVFEIDGDFLPRRKENIACPFLICSCPKDLLCQVSHVEKFTTHRRTLHEVSFRDEKDKEALHEQPPVTKLR